MAFDYKKEYKEFYMPKNKPSIVEIPRMNYIAVRGTGNPNEENGDYKNTIGLLYGVAYTIKMSYKGNHKIDGFFEYVVPPLEGFWWQDHVEGVDYSNKSAFNWISVIRLPDFITKKDFDSFARKISKTTYIASILSAFVIGVYDGFYGPGTGTFLLLCLTRFAGLDVLTASGVTKFINLVTNLTALVTFLFYGKVYLLLGFVAGICSILGNLIGSGMLTKNADKVLKPAILGVICIFFVRTVTSL